MPDSADHSMGGTYHVRLASMKASWFPAVIRQIFEEVPDDAGVILDLCDAGTLDRFSARSLREATRDAVRRGVKVAIAANDDTVRRCLFREQIDRWAGIGTDMSRARVALGDA